MKAIVAMAENRAIGKDGKMPWKIKEDFQWFKKYTMGKTLVMGWHTFQSLPIKLKGRRICVLTKTLPKIGFENLSMCYEKADYVYFKYPPNHKCPNDHMSKFYPKDWDRAIVAGGAKTYELLMPYVTELFVTHVRGNYDGDVFMPLFEHLFSNQTVVKEFDGHKVIRYNK